MKESVARNNSLSQPIGGCAHVLAEDRRGAKKHPSLSLNSPGSGGAPIHEHAYQLGALDPCYNRVNAETIRRTLNLAFMRPTSPNVAHGQNADGTTTSVCNRCPLTIGRAIDENDLAELESRHVCQPVERRQMVRIVHRTYIPPVRTDRRLGGSSREVLNGDGWILSQAAKVELIKAHLFLAPLLSMQGNRGISESK